MKNGDDSEELVLFDLSDDDVGGKVVALRLGEFDLVLPTLSVGHAVGDELFLPLIGPLSTVVVLGVDNDASLVVLQIGDDVAPPLVVVYADSGDEVLTVIRKEADGAGGAAATHGELVLAIAKLRPTAAVGVLPHRLLDDAEESVGVGLEDAEGDGVAHSVGGQIYQSDALDQRQRSGTDLIAGEAFW